MIGYPKNTKGCKLWDFKTQKVIISRDVLFKEEKQSTEICEQDDNCDDEIKHLTPNTKEADVENVDAFESTNYASELDHVRGISIEHAAENIEPSVDKSIGVRRSGRIKIAPGPWWAHTAFIATCTEPKTFRQPITCDDAPQSKSAMSTEYQSLMKHNTWNLVPHLKTGTSFHTNGYSKQRRLKLIPVILMSNTRPVWLQKDILKFMASTTRKHSHQLLSSLRFEFLLQLSHYGI
jgi:hypothetical protein